MGMTEEIKAYILAAVIPGGNPWIDPDVDSTNGNIFRNFFPPDVPDRAMCLYQMPGGPDQRGLGNTIMWENPRLRVSVRGAISDFEEAKLDSFHIRDLLKVVTNKTVSGIYYMSMRPAGEPAAESLDPTNRPIFYTEYEVMKYPSE